MTAGSWLRRLLAPTLTAAILCASLAGYVYRSELRLAYWAGVMRREPDRRKAAIEALAPYDSARLIEVFAPSLDDSDAQARCGAALALCTLAEPKDLSPRSLGAGGYQQVLLVTRAYRLSYDYEDGDLLGLSFETDPPRAPGAVGEEEEGGLVPQGVGDASFGLEFETDYARPARLLGDCGSEAIGRLQRAVREGPDPYVRQVAAQALGFLQEPDEDTQSLLFEAARADPDLSVRHMALRSLLGIQAPWREQRPLDDGLRSLCRELLGAGDVPLGATAARALAAAGALEGEDSQAVHAALLASLPPREGATLDRITFEQDDALLGAAALGEQDDAVSQRLWASLSAPNEVASVDQETLVALGGRLRVPEWLGLAPRPPGNENTDGVVVAWLASARSDPSRLAPLLLSAGGRDSFFAVQEALRQFPRVRRFMADAAQRAPLVKEVGALLVRLQDDPLQEWSTYPLYDPLIDRPSLALHLVDVLLVCGGEDAAKALDAFAAQGPQAEDSEDPMQVERARASVAASLLRGQLPEGLRRGLERTRAWLGAHVGADGRVSGASVHPADHRCALQGRGIRVLEHRTPLACLALLGREGGRAAMLPTVRWLAAPGQDDLGYFSARESSPVSDGRLGDSAAIGNVSRGVVEAIAFLALERAVQCDVAPAEARAALDRRLARLLEQSLDSVVPEDQGGLALVFASSAGRSPKARERALALRARLFERARYPAFAFYQRRWLVAPAQQPAYEAVLSPMPQVDGCDSWLGSLALGAPGVDPVEARWWLWSVCAEAAFDLRQEPRVPECPGSVIRVGQEDPVILTAWTALTLEALQEALRRGH